MKILIYNFLQPEAGGGGVGVYSTNLVQGLRQSGHNVITLSSGDVYSMMGNTPTLETRPDRPDRAIVVNSPMIAPAYDAWDDFATYTESGGLDHIPGVLRAKFGDIDVFHLQNIEGLTSSFLRQLRKQFPSAKIIYSAHNYGTVCPQVDLWFQERKVCIDYRDGLDCTRCFPPRESSATIRRARRRRPIVRAVNRYLPRLAHAKRSVMKLLKGRPGGVVSGPHDSALIEGPRDSFDMADDEGPLFAFKSVDGDGAPYARFRETNIDICAGVFDHVLAVSQRTRKVLLARGVKPDNVAVSYIGTAHRAKFDSARKIMSIGSGLHIAYLGYMRRSKGFYLLLKALELLPDDVAQRVSLTVAAKRAEDMPAYAHLTRVASRFASFHYHDGFTHRTLDAVLEGVNLGIVPPIWEDNLPQVGIEIVSRGIPILTSDRGGAQEIADNPDFVFEGGSATNLQQRICEFSAEKIALSEFWKHDIRILSVEDHIQDLMRYYGA